MATIIYTRTDEAPLLATYSLKPIIEAFAQGRPSGDGLCPAASLFPGGFG